MFTGIIEATGTLDSTVADGGNQILVITSPISSSLAEDQSVCHNGVCLTVTRVHGKTHEVTAVAETLEKTTMGLLKPGATVNLERSLKLGDRLDGHLVQGHIDCMGTCCARHELNGSHVFRFRFPETFSSLIIEKGSVCVDGISLTAFGLTQNEFSVAIIPYTYSHTNMQLIALNDAVNLEFDMVGKYISRQFSYKERQSALSSIV
jgi:riboflavin synthase